MVVVVHMGIVVGVVVVHVHLGVVVHFHLGVVVGVVVFQ